MSIWIDHILCSKEFSSQISSIEAVGTGAILSDPVPLSFMLRLDCTLLSFDVSPSKVADCSPDWSRAFSHSIDKFQDSFLQSLAPFNPCVTECLSADRSAHLPYMDEYAQNLVTSIVSCASHCIPSPSSNTHRLPSCKD